jgi:hypothetical protein
MKQFFVLLAAALFTLTACEKEDHKIEDGPRTEVPAELQSLWMHGEFSVTEYWSTDPSEYLGPALQMAFAFKFNSDGTYTQYFTASSVQSGGTTYQQSVSTGTVEIDPVNKTITTHTNKAHYKRTRNGQTLEERDLDKSETNGATRYTYTLGTEPSGTKALYLTLENTQDPLTFLQKQ